MPTGYTAVIEEREVSFPEFVWRCARAFGALIEMREDSLDAKIPETFDPSPYHAEQLAEAEKRLASVRAVTYDESKRRARAENRRRVNEWRDSEKKRRAMMARYERVRRAADKWKPPTPEHTGLREFMLDQIRISTEHMQKPRARPKAMSAAEWRQAQVASSEWDVNYHAKELRAERERVGSRNEWVAALRKSVPPPSSPTENRE